MKKLTPLKPLLPQRQGDRVYWGGLYGAAQGLAIYSAAQNYPKSLLVITPDTLTASHLTEELHFFASKEDPIPFLIFPDWEILPYDSFSPHQDIISERLLTLYKIPQLQKGIIITSINTLMHRLSPRHYLEANTFFLSQGETIDPLQLRSRLEQSGYRYVSQVLEHGEFAVRGSIIDLFPMGSELPFRIDLFGNEVDSIRTFDPETQRSIETIQAINLLPAREFPLTEDAITYFRQHWRNKFTGNPNDSFIYQNISRGECSPGIEYYLPLFFDKTNSLFDYMPSDSMVIGIGELHAHADLFWKEVNERYEQLRHDITRPLLSPNELFLAPNQLFSALKNFPHVEVRTETVPEKAGYVNFATKEPPELKINPKEKHPFSIVENYLTHTQARVLFCAETAGRRETLLGLLKDSDILPTPVETWKDFLASTTKIDISIAPIEHGLCLEDPAISVIAESQLFGQQVMQRRLRKKTQHDPGAIIRNLMELKPHSPVVHIDHGVGRYVGLQTIKTGEVENEYLTLVYADGDKLYVPVSSLHLISRYTGREDEQAPLHSLGSKKWEKIKHKAAERIKDTAAELLEIYAKRQTKKGLQFSMPNTHYATFSAAFPFEETPDQRQTIEQVINDMTSPKSMDRLVCGDVGFGKTEVAMRAAFIAVNDNKQVAVLVPTTLLAEQHLQNFRDRFADWPIKIDSLSRFRSGKEQEQIKENIKTGKLDIIIGTHKLLDKDLQFQSLGLLIIDEEHRFGVHQKEKIKKLKSEVDILTLTATPIPRTLNFSLVGIRDLSIIATPPARRLSIKTFVREYDKPLIREAILREILRGGQVYFLHNEVQNIDRIANEITSLVPEARIAIAHGQMPERQLERIMSDFYHLRYNVLICTTIIESGIDIPTANTMIINRANQFGLAQLHQLRGRVGRSHHQAYSYLLIHDFNRLTKEAKRRLEAIESLEDLGAGFTLATYDLEIRGAGEILGEEQSGFMEEIGFTLYMELLEAAVKTLKSGEQFSFDKTHTETEIDLQISAFIPETYVADVNTRLSLYKRISSIKSAEELEEIHVEMIDRFGLLPPQAKNLFEIASIKLETHHLGIRRIDGALKYGRIEFTEQPKINIEVLLKLINQSPQLYQFDGPHRVRINWEAESAADKIKAIKHFIEKIKTN